MRPVEIAARLSDSYLFHGIPMVDVATLAEAATTRRLVRGEHLWYPGDPANELYVVHSGEVKDFLVDADGVEILHLLHGPGMTLGEPGYFSVERVRSVADMAVSAAVVIRLDRRDLGAFLRRHPGAKDRALEGLAAMVRWYGGVFMSRERRPLQDRLLLRLLDLVDSNAASNTAKAATPPISQSTLASMTGVSRENVNRALAGLILDGAVRREGSRYVLVDVDGLRRRVTRDWPVTPLRDRRSDPTVP